VIVLDTDVVSELRLANPDPSVATWFAALPGAEIAVASFTITEIAYGIANVEPTRPALAAQLTLWLNAIVATQCILPLDASAGRILGGLHATAALRHLATTAPGAAKPRFGGDLVIAATAAAHGASVATRNVTDYALVARHCQGLSGLNPWTGRTF
jgi:toxin FitB